MKDRIIPTVGGGSKALRLQMSPQGELLVGMDHYEHFGLLDVDGAATLCAAAGEYVDGVAEFPKRTQLRRFTLVRKEDVHGVSGTGVVADGVQFANGYCALTWKSEFASVAVYHSIDVLEKIHGHEGRTVVEWIDR